MKNNFKNSLNIQKIFMKIIGNLKMKLILQKWQEDTEAEMPIKNKKFDRNRRNEWGMNPYTQIK